MRLKIILQKNSLFSPILFRKERIFFFFFASRAAPPLRFQIFFEFCCGGFFFTLRQCLIQGFRFQDRGVSCFCAQKFFSTADQGRWEHRELYFFFLRSKKNQTNGAAGEKKFRIRCKNLAFYSIESHSESFFAEQKRKNGAAGKKMAPQAKKN